MRKRFTTSTLSRSRLNTPTHIHHLHVHVRHAGASHNFPGPVPGPLDGRVYGRPETENIPKNWQIHSFVIRAVIPVIPVVPSLPLLTCDPSPCYPGVDCRDTPRGPQCGSCLRGYTGNGQVCSKINVITCVDRPCFQGVRCYDVSEGYK